ncbi:restriction endonuclease [Enterobacter quasiroggenkampii]|uniref:restriction endonuclease n=1 Tax=Enterobacter quasiroggenkampii TaxID=2497436 RepID=UPI00211F13F2|nr:restriction endonuclease [Enterobacter quasiroggenkampii]MEB7932062.1 restriction endonuclease [Enterobacter quasiroggenkampii]
MGGVSSQVLAEWVVADLQGNEWEAFPISLERSVKKHMGNKSDDEIADIVEEHTRYVIDILRDIVESERVSGIMSKFELDEEEPPYIRSVITGSTALILENIRRSDPIVFEKICAEIVKSIGATATSIGGSDDGGIDFIGVDLNIHSGIKSMPAMSKFMILGQAKRYKKSNSVSLNELRQFVGSCKAKTRELIVQGKLGPMTPVIYAFWTTSSFDQKASDYAHNMGLWYMDGYSISCHIDSLGISLQDLLNS